MRGSKATKASDDVMIGATKKAEQLIEERCAEGKFCPRNGQLAFCQHGILGIVESAVVQNGDLVFRGRRYSDPFKNWQSKNPVEYADEAKKRLAEIGSGIEGNKGPQKADYGR